MATQNSKSSKPKATANTAAQTKSSGDASRAEQARIAAERAVDLPVGAVLEVSDTLSGLAEPFSGRSAAQKQLKSYGNQLRRTAKRTERRGAVARRKATTEARKTRTRVEREARKRVERVGDQLAALR